MITFGECRWWRELCQTGETVQVHVKQNIQRGNVSVMVSYTHIHCGSDWTKTRSLACLYILLYVHMYEYIYLRLVVVVHVVSILI